MPVLSNQKHEAFAQLVATGEAAGAAYRQIYPSASAATAETTGPELLRKPQVKARVEELQEAGASKAVFTLATTIEYLEEILVTPIGEVDEGHRLCQELSETSTESGTTRKVKMPGKLEAIEKLIKLRGWYKPDKVEHSGTVAVSHQVAEALANLGIKGA